MNFLFSSCESCNWFATILVNKFNINHCYICKKKVIHMDKIVIQKQSIKYEIVLLLSSGIFNINCHSLTEINSGSLQITMFRLLQDLPMTLVLSKYFFTLIPIYQFLKFSLYVLSMSFTLVLIKIIDFQPNFQPKGS